MISVQEAYNLLMQTDPDFKIKGAVDYDDKLYVFASQDTDMYAVDKNSKTIYTFLPTGDLKKYTEAVKERSVNISKLNQNEKTGLQQGGKQNMELHHGDLLIVNGRLILSDPSNYLAHYGVKNQKWGQRRWQNPDGSLTAAGYIHYGYGKAKKGASKAVDTAKKVKDRIDTGVAAYKEKKAVKEEEKRAKLKEEVSKSPYGVAKHPELFTAEELEALRKRFEIEDKIRTQGKKLHEDERAKAKQQKRELIEDKQEEKQAKIDAKKEKKRLAFEAEKERIKEKALSDPDLLMDDRYKKYFTNAELEEARKRFDTEAKIRRQAIDQQFEESMAGVDRAKTYMGLIGNTATTIGNIANTVIALDKASYTLTGHHIGNRNDKENRFSNDNNNKDKNNNGNKEKDVKDALYDLIQNINREREQKQKKQDQDQNKDKGKQKKKLNRPSLDGNTDMEKQYKSLSKKDKNVVDFVEKMGGVLNDPGSSAKEQLDAHMQIDAILKSKNLSTKVDEYLTDYLGPDYINSFFSHGDLLIVNGTLILDDPSNYLAHHGMKGRKFGGKSKWV